MSFATPKDFESRKRSVIRHHRRLSRGGAVLRIGADGLVTARPRRALRLPWRALLGIVVMFFLAKAAVLSQVGGASYGERLALLEQGTAIERAGAWALSADPMTQVVAAQMRLALGQ